MQNEEFAHETAEEPAGAEQDRVVEAMRSIPRMSAVEEVDDKVRKYMLDLVTQTRSHDDIRLGGSPRASIALFRTSQALAAIRGRNFVLPDDVKRLAVPVLAHRIILKPEARLRKLNATRVVETILTDTAVPVPTTEAKTA